MADNNVSAIGRSPANSSFAASETPYSTEALGEEQEIKKNSVIAGKAPIQGTTLESAYYTTLAAGNYDNVRNRVDATNLTTSNAMSKAAEARAQQAMLDGKYTPSHMIKNMGFEAKASFFEAIEKYKNGPVPLSKDAKRAVKTAVGKVQGAVSQNDDMGSNVINGAISTGVMAHTGFKVAQKGADRLVHAKLTKSATNFSTIKKVLTTPINLENIKLAVKKIPQKLTHGLVNGAVWTVRKGIPNAAGKITNGGANLLSSSNDMMLKGVGNAMTLTKYGVKTSASAVKATGRTVKTAVKGGVKTVKTTYRAVSFIRQNGLKAAWAKARNKAGKAFAKAGKSVVNAVINVLKSAGQKIILPLILIVVVVIICMSLFSAPVAAVGSIFSGLFNKDNEDGTFTETDVRNYVSDPTKGVPAKRTEYINNLYNHIQEQYKANGGQYDYVRLKTSGQSGYIDTSLDGITNSFFTEDEMTNLITPLFNAVILKDYSLSPTDWQAEDAMDNICANLFKQKEATATEYCGQSAIDGSGNYVTCSCGSIHALTDCPNPVTGTHTDYTCSECDYYRCTGHKGDLNCEIEEHTHEDSCYRTIGGRRRRVCGKEEHTHEDWTSKDEPGCYKTSYCGGCVFVCSGYTYCGGHDVLTLTVSTDGIYQLIYQYFEQPIDELSNLSQRTEDEEQALDELKDYYEICMEFLNEMSEDFGELTKDDLADVTFITGTRPGNQNVVNIALNQLGQGGDIYWSWYGFPSRVGWSACFVSWVMDQAGHSEIKYAGDEGIDIFKNSGKWQDSTYTDLAAGDVVFYDWNDDGFVDSSGIIIGTDGKYIYTVDGNSCDTVKIKKYNHESSIIMGYGLVD